jgi:hypothetical protein
VALCESPSLPPTSGAEAAFDYAFIAVTDADEATWQQSRFVPALQPPPPLFETARRVDVFAGISGYVDDVSLWGALMDVAHVWKDCWLIGPTDAMTTGDSGSGVADHETKEHLGMLAGRSLIGERAQHLYVQSLDRLMAERLRDDGVLIEQTAGR